MLSTHDFILVLNLLLKEISCLHKPCAVFCNVVVKDFCSQVLTHAETISTADLNPVEQLNADTGMQEHVNSSVLEGIAHFVVAYQE